MDDTETTKCLSDEDDILGYDDNLAIGYGATASFSSDSSGSSTYFLSSNSQSLYGSDSYYNDETNVKYDNNHSNNILSNSITMTCNSIAGIDTIIPTTAVEAVTSALQASQALHESTAVPVEDGHGHLAHYPGEEEDLYHRQQYKRESQVQTLLTIDSTQPGDKLKVKCLFEFFKCAYSMALLLISIGAVMMAIGTRQTVATASGVPVPVALVIFWFLIVWLAKMEGGQACLVGLQPVEKCLYNKSHPKTLVSTIVAHKGDNMERFIIGRQFLVCLVVFVSNLMASTIEGASIPGLSQSWTDALLTSGNAVTLIAIIIGQSAQINAANCMLDFINTKFWIFTTYTSLLLDMSGLLHSVYLFQIVFAKLADTPVDSDEPPRNALQQVFFWVRVIFSTTLLLLSLAVTLAALWLSETTMYAGVPRSVSLVLLFVLLSFVGMMEGMQIALFAVVNLPSSDLKDHPLAAKCCQLAFQGSNLQAFLIGRQMCVTLCMFIVARLTSCNVDVSQAGPSLNIFGVSDWVQEFFNTGMLGAFITTVIGSLVWRILASNFPVAFLSNPLVYAIIRLCLLVELSGVCSAAWPLALIQKNYMFGYKLDEDYIGTPEERLLLANVKDITETDRTDYASYQKDDVETANRMLVQVSSPCA